MANFPPLDAPVAEEPIGANPLPERRLPRRARTSHLVWIIVPLVFATLGWSLFAGEVIAERLYQLGQATGVVLIGALGLVLGFYTKHATVQIERAYSGHLEGLSQRLRSLAYQDSLTDLYNHRYFYEQLTHEVERANRYGRPVSVILLDLDNFKDVNDTYGHLMGDKLLTLMGRVIKEQVRGADIPARYGGDEFAIILPDTTRAAAEATAEKLSRAIATGHTNAGPLSESLPLSASCGVACCPDEARTVSDLLQLADDRVYKAKKSPASPPALSLAQ
ncbi:MAG: GGDEF domain-containing protein [Dehalococcoidia bacterium]